MSPAGAELIRAMAAGDREAFRRFYDRYAPMVLALLLRILRRREAAAAVLEDVFWESWREARAYDPAAASPEAWLVARARDRAVARLRASDDPAAPGAAGGPGAAPEPLPVLGGLLEWVPPAPRHALRLAYFGGQTETELAELLGVSREVVRARLVQALESLRRARAEAAR